MERDELKLMWLEVHKGNQPNNKENIKKLIKMKHSKVVSKILAEQKRRVIAYSICFFAFLSLIVYAFSYLKVSLSTSSLMPFALAGLFLFFKITSETNRYRILSNSEDKLSIKDSILFFHNKVKRIEKVDFISNICLFYIVAIGVSILIINDKGAINMFNGMIPFLILFILTLLSMPWLIRYIYRQKYKKTYLFLKNNLNSLDDE